MVVNWLKFAEHSLLNWWLEDLIVFIYLKFNPLYAQDNAKCRLFEDLFDLKTQKCGPFSKDYNVNGDVNLPL